jgi:hypothetical protein
LSAFVFQEDKMVTVLVFGPSTNQTSTLQITDGKPTSSNATTLKLGGRMLRQPGLDTELLSGVLHPNLDSGAANKALMGAGGLAIVSVDSQTGGLHVNTIFTGVMPPTAKYNIPFKLTLVHANAPAGGNKDDSVILDHDFVVDKTSMVRSFFYK